MDSRVGIQAKIFGRVQGVNFRASTLREAEKQALTGWVKNCPDGSVELVAEGNKSNITSFLNWCNQGPPSSQVDHVEWKFIDYSGKFKKFEILRSV